MDNVYIQRRKGKNYTSYRLHARIETIIDYLKEFVNKEVNSILDIGTSDGRLLFRVATEFNIKRAVGIDIKEDAIRVARQLNRNKNFKFFLGNTIALPIKDCLFDILSASAIVEHISNIDVMLDECNRVLKKEGLLCITIPNPFYDWINSKLVSTYHVKRYTLKYIKKILMKHNFRILRAGHFMLFPFFRFPLEGYIIKFLRFINLDFILFNQIIISTKQ